MELEPYKIRASKIGAALCLQGSEVAKVEKDRGDDKKKKKRGREWLNRGKSCRRFFFFFFFFYCSQPRIKPARTRNFCRVSARLCPTWGEWRGSAAGDFDEMRPSLKGTRWNAAITRSGNRAFSRENVFHSSTFVELHRCIMEGNDRSR